jgi:hypothetical protein
VMTCILDPDPAQTTSSSQGHHPGGLQEDLTVVYVLLDVLCGKCQLTSFPQLFIYFTSHFVLVG